ncbi:MAG: substrate-binding domain-containing protein, partial [Anaerolineae bacterium]
KIVIGWTPPDITGVFKTATDFFELSAEDAKVHGINVEVISQSPVTHIAFADQVAIIEDYIQRQVDVIAISAIEVEVIRPAIKKANEAGIPVIIVNQLEPIEGIEVASYIGFDNTVVGAISAYSVVDYLGGPGILGEGEEVEVEPGTYLDLAWWQALYKDVDPMTIDVKGRVAIIEGISGSWRGENRLVRSDGSVVYVDSIIFPIHDEAGQFIGLVASFRDATQRKQAEEERERLQEQVIQAQRQALRELSTPIVPVAEGIIIMPLIGSIDTARSQQIMEVLLEGISRHQADVVLIDITGVPVVDTSVASHLMQVTRAASLLGSKCILVGISPTIAQTIVQLGVDLSGLDTRASLQSGIEYALELQGKCISQI